MFLVGGLQLSLAFLNTGFFAELFYKTLNEKAVFFICSGEISSKDKIRANSLLALDLA